MWAACHILCTHILLPLSLVPHSFMYRLIFLWNLQYCSDIMNLLCHSLNLMPKTKKMSFAVLCFSFSSEVSIFIRCSSSWPDQLLISGAFSYQFIHILWFLGCLWLPLWPVLPSWMMAFQVQVCCSFFSDVPYDLLWGWPGSCICIFESHHHCFCCLDGHLAHYFLDSFIFCIIFTYFHGTCLLFSGWLCLSNLRLFTPDTM